MINNKCAPYLEELLGFYSAVFRATVAIEFVSQVKQEKQMPGFPQKEAEIQPLAMSIALGLWNNQPVIPIHPLMSLHWLLKLRIIEKTCFPCGVGDIDYPLNLDR